MMSAFEDHFFIIHYPVPGTFFARQAMALIKVRDLYHLLTNPPQEMKKLGFPKVKKTEIDEDTVKLLDDLYRAAGKAEAHTTFSDDGYSYETLELIKGIQLLY